MIDQRQVRQNPGQTLLLQNQDAAPLLQEAADKRGSGIPGADHRLPGRCFLVCNGVRPDHKQRGTGIVIRQFGDVLEYHGPGFFLGSPPTAGRVEDQEAAAGRHGSGPFIIHLKAGGRGMQFFAARVKRGLKGQTPGRGAGRQGDGDLDHFVPGRLQKESVHATLTPPRQGEPRLKLQGMHAVIKDIERSHYLLPAEEPGVKLTLEDGHGRIGPLLGLEERTLPVGQAAIGRDGPGAQAGYTGPPVGHRLDFPGAGLGQILVDVLVPIGFVAVEDRAGRVVLAEDPEVLADVKRLFPVPGEILVPAAGRSPGRAGGDRGADPIGGVGVVDVFGKFTRVMEADHVGRTARIMVGLIGDEVGRVQYLDPPAGRGQALLGAAAMAFGSAVQ